MPSLADRTRVAAEWVARAIGVAALMALLWSVTRPVPRAAPEVFEGGGIREALAGWTQHQPADSVHLTLDVAPDATERDWLVALRRAGVGISWRAPSVPAIAIATEALAEPRGRRRISVAGPRGGTLAIRDAVGTIDSVSISGLGTAVIAPAVGITAAGIGIHGAAASLPDSIALRRLLVTGRAGWESRFVIAALEEEGWQVDADLFVAPGAVVRQGTRGAIDTAGYSVVVVLDASAADDAPAVARFARNGGGVVLAGGVANTTAFAAIAPGRAARRWQPTVRLATQPASLVTTGYLPVTSLSREAVVLRTGDGGVAVAAHRVGSGRVVQAGYDETWRWRMAGGDEGPEAHRAWWAGLVTAAAYAPVIDRSPTASGVGDAAPLASLVAAMGAPRPSPFSGGTSPARRSAYEALLFAVAIAAFLAEWASRRLRGAA